MDLDSDDLDAWIATLRIRIRRGDLVGQPQVNLGDGTHVNADLVAEIMLDEFDRLAELSPVEQDSPDHIVKRRSLMWDLLWLRQQIGQR